MRAVVAAAILLLGMWGLVTFQPGPFLTVTNNSGDGWVLVEVFGGERTLVLADGTRWKVVAIEPPGPPDPWEIGLIVTSQRLAKRPGVVFFADLRDAGDGFSLIDVHREVAIVAERTWNPLRETTDQWAHFTTLRARRR